MPKELLEKNEKIRVRIAPSPTGTLHVGTARTALFNFLFAKHYGGEFLIRIEDTDTERSKKEFEKDILSGLEWLGITPDEEPQRQSERKEKYKKHIEKLLADKKAFYCPHSTEELKKEQQDQLAAKEAPRHICEHRNEKITDENIIKKSVIRFKNDHKGKVEFFDFVRKEVSFNEELLGDFSIAKSTEQPLYNLAVVVDDADMEISHIIRGEDHISNTPRQIMLIEALGFKIPKYIHIPLLLGPDKSKLSKRHGASSISEYAQEGYLADAMFNFLAILGWKPKSDKEVMSREEIIKEFAVEDIQQTGAVFDIEKLKWMNALYIRDKNLDEIAALCIPYLVDKEFAKSEVTNYRLPLTEQASNSKFQTNLYGDVSFDWIKKLVAMEQERIKTLSEIGEAVEFVFNLPEYDAELLAWRKSTKEDALDKLKALNDIMKNIESKEWTKENLESIIMPEAEKTGLPAEAGPAQVGDRGSVLWPLRVAVSGKKNSPGPFEILEVLGRTETLERIKRAVSKLEK